MFERAATPGTTNIATNRLGLDLSTTPPTVKYYDGAEWQTLMVRAVVHADLAAPTVTTAEILGVTVGVGTSVQAAVTALTNDLNTLKARLRSAGILAV